MKNKTNFYLSLLVLFTILITSCKKYGNGYVKGKVIERETNAPVEGATVYLKRFRINSDEHKPMVWELIDSVKTNSDGGFALNYHKHRRYRYYIGSNHPTGIGYPDFFDKQANEVSAKEITTKKITQNIILPPLSYLKFRIKKNLGVASYFRLGLYYNDYTYISNSSVPYDTILSQIFRVYGNNQNTIGWEVKPSGGLPTQSFQKQIYFNAGDTLTYFIEYD